MHGHTTQCMWRVRTMRRGKRGYLGNGEREMQNCLTELINEKPG